MQKNVLKAMKDIPENIQQLIMVNYCKELEEGIKSIIPKIVFPDLPYTQQKTTPQTIGALLLQTDQEEFRNDFLIGAGWMDFIRKKPENINLIIAEMKKQFVENETPEGDIDQQKLILDFAARMLQSGLAKAEQFNDFTSKRKKISQLAASLNDLVPPPPVEDILNTSGFFKVISPRNLNDSLMNARQRVEFISSFAEDLNTVSSSIFASVLPSEFYGSQKNKNITSPNITSLSLFFNQTSNYVIEQILAPNLKMEDRIKIRETFINIAFELIEKHHNYHAAQAIIAAVSNQPVYRLFDDSKTKTEELKVSLNSKIREDLKKGISHVPYLGTYLTAMNRITEASDNEDGTINLKKMNQMVKLYQNISNLQNLLPQNRNLLHFDISKQIFQRKFPSENAFYQASYRIIPRKQKT